MIIQVNHAPLVSLYMYGAHSQQMRSKLMGLVAGRATFVVCGCNSWPAVPFELTVTPEPLMEMRTVMKNNDNASFPLHEQLVNRIKHTKSRWQLGRVCVHFLMHARKWPYVRTNCIVCNWGAGAPQLVPVNNVDVLKVCNV